MAEHTLQDLRIRQKLPLEAKVAMTKVRLREWVSYYGLDGVYISFSGGKDSTVLLHIARQIYPDIKAVFVDTGLEYPEIRQFVKTFDNVDWIKPKMNFKQVIEKYGYPFISKEVSECVWGARKYLRSIISDGTLITDRQTDRQTDRISISTTNLTDLANILNKRMQNREGGNNQRLAIMLGMLTKNSEIKAIIPDDERSTFSQEKYKFMLEAPFEISNKCCNVMKKSPAHDYNNKTGRKPMLATMADESTLRLQKWLQNGCNGFEMKSPVSTPMAFWTDQDVLKYVKEYGIEICSVYGNITTDYEAQDQLDGQMDICDLGLADDTRPLKTTGCKRTGCMFCGFGCHLNNDERFTKMKETHPKQYEYIMKPKEQSGLGYKEVIDWINEHGDLNIKY